MNLVVRPLLIKFVGSRSIDFDDATRSKRQIWQLHQTYYPKISLLSAPIQLTVRIVGTKKPEVESHPAKKIESKLAILNDPLLIAL